MTDFNFNDFKQVTHKPTPEDLENYLLVQFEQFINNLLGEKGYYQHYNYQTDSYINLDFEYQPSFEIQRCVKKALSHLAHNPKIFSYLVHDQCRDNLYTIAPIVLGRIPNGNTCFGFDFDTNDITLQFICRVHDQIRFLSFYDWRLNEEELEFERDVYPSDEVSSYEEIGINVNLSILDTSNFGLDITVPETKINEILNYFLDPSPLF